MIWRQELKYVISGADRVQILHRLQNAMTPDPFALADGTYRVRTLYFDDLFDSAMYDSLSGAPVTSTDLRAGAAMVIAGLCAHGVTEVGGVDYIDRGYEDFVGKLKALGADIERVDDGDDDQLEREA